MADKLNMRPYGFNPTVVRLVPATVNKARKFTACFNPTVVRLVPLVLFLYHTAMRVFQSHRGSISTCEKYCP